MLCFFYRFCTSKCSRQIYEICLIYSTTTLNLFKPNAGPVNYWLRLGPVMAHAWLLSLTRIWTTPGPREKGCVDQS